MKRKAFGKKMLVTLLAFLMALPIASLQVNAEVGDLSNVSTGLSGDIDKNDTISLPIQILDYESDGMLFEYGESIEVKDAYDFGATHATAFTKYGNISEVTNSDYGNFWSYTTNTLNTSNGNASFLRATYAANSTQNPHYGRAGIIMPNDLSGLSMDDVRYLVLVYRSNVTSGKIGFFVERANADRNNNNNKVGDLTFTSEGTTNWTYAVYDLKQGNLASSWSNYGNPTAIWTTLPLDASGEYIDIAHVALFRDADLAKAFGEYALTDGSDRGDNRGFGLLRSSRNESNGDNYRGIVDETSTVKQMNTYGDSTSAIDFSTVTSLGYTLLGTFKDEGIANVGLLKSSLSKDGNPEYKEEVVTYMANLLKHSLEISERTSDGWKNYRYVKGTASSIYGGTDLATALRTRINKNMGSYSAASGKNLVGTWSECQGNIASYYDAAYFLLNSIFVNGSYNDPQDDYDYLVLSAGTDSDSGDKVYVFDGGFTTSSTPASAKMAIDYNATDGTIQNSSAAGKTHFVYQGTSTTTLNPFLPVTDKNNAEGQTKSVYYQDDGLLNKTEGKDSYVNRDFNFALYSSGEFVYHADDELFFDFEGDDDVYLFINDELVMDIGSAHSIDGVRFELNDYVNQAKAGKLGSEERNKKLSLEEGNTYSFKFYYMERHGYGSNMRIMTNIRVTDPSMTTAKTAWQNGQQLDFGSIVDKDQVVEYGFALTNNGEENLYNLTFTDNDIGVKLDPDDGLTVTGDRVYDVNGEQLEATDLTAIITSSTGDSTTKFANNEALKSFLENLNANGLEKDATLQIRGIGYKLSDEQINAGVFDNTVFTTATNSRKSKKLQGQASMRVFVPADPMYYEWAGHDLQIDVKTKFVPDILEAANQESNILSGKVPNLNADNINRIETCTKTGNATTYKEVTINGTSTITVNYNETGSKVFYIKVTYNNSNNSVIVPVLVNIVDVKDKVLVLDYGLKAELTSGDELFKGDTLTVPGRSTNFEILGVTSDTPSYTPNDITFNNMSPVDGTYGKYEFNAGKLTYTPDEFMEGEDKIFAAISVHETDYTSPKLGKTAINDEAQMYKSVSVLPANVVYYEDDFPAIHYANEDGTETGNIFTKTGDGSGSLTQSVDQQENYGHDAAYADSSNTDKSGNSLTTITINNNKQVAYFEFKGTGFELIGRTNAYDSATLTVKVTDENGNKVKNIPVITEFDNDDNGGTEEIYQVPVIRVDDLTYGKYRVTISGVPARDYENLDANGEPTIVPTILYLDGLRIYNPLGSDELTNNYTAEEKGAEFKEIRNLIMDAYVGAVEYDGSSVKVSTGTTTWVENYQGQYEGNEVDSVDDYLISGPNNEIYMSGDQVDSALVFYVKESGNGAHNLQIALHGVDEGLFYGAGSKGISTSIKYGVGSDWKQLVTAVSATEQYYTIDYTECPFEDGYYQIAVLIDEGMASFTSLKLNGLELKEMDGPATTLYYENGVLKDAANDTEAVGAYPAFYSVRSQMAVAASDDAEIVTPDEEEDSDETEISDVDEDKDETETSDIDEDKDEIETPDIDEDKDETEAPDSNEDNSDGETDNNAGNVSKIVGLFKKLVGFIGSWFK